MRHTLAVALLAGVSGWSTSALAQNALGDGRALQRDLRAPGGYSRPDFAQEVRMRNALVTGNIGGGRSLQIASPYADQDDFRGALGTDSLFRFRRDSFGVNSPTNFRASEGIQYQFSGATGYTRADEYVTRLTAASGQAISTAATNEPRSAAAPFARGVQDATQSLNTMRSSAGFASSRGLTPALIGFKESPTGAAEILASPLLGVRTLAEVKPVAATDASRQAAATNTVDTNASTFIDRAANAPVITAYDEMRAKFDARARGEDNPLGRPPAANEITLPGSKREAVPGRTDQPNTPARPGDGTPPSGPAAPSSVPARPGSAVTPAGGTPSSINPALPTRPSALPGSTPPGASDGVQPPPSNFIDSELTRLRARLTDRTPRPAEGSSTPEVSTPGAAAKSPDARWDRKNALEGISGELFKTIRESQTEVSAYLRGDIAPGDLYASHIMQGQRSMAAAQYFDAEERFARAVAMRPGDVTAMAGRIHAQLGAGLYLSAAMNLRRLFEIHPEVAATRFSGETMPKPERLISLRDDLRQTIQKTRERGEIHRAAYPLLLAYLGWQTDNPEDIRLGLEAAYEADSQAASSARTLGQPQPAPDALVPLLEAIWLGDAPRTP